MTVNTLISVLDLPADAKNMRVKDILERKKLGQDDLNYYSILAKLPGHVKRDIVAAAAEDPFSDRAMGAMLGMAVGDSLGAPLEFLPAREERDEYHHFDLAKMDFVGPKNTFRLERGQWTDDAAMGLCMADSLILLKGFDGVDMRVRFWCWWNRGYNNAFRLQPNRSSSVGLGGNISDSLKDLDVLTSASQQVPPAYNPGADKEDAGNGSLMRFAPIAIFARGAPSSRLYSIARESSYTTHPGILAAEVCSLLAHLLVAALRQPESHGPIDARAFLEKATGSYLMESGLATKSGWGYDQMKWLVTGNPPNDTERCWRWKADRLEIAATLKARGREYNGYPVSEGYFGSYCMDGMAMALWSVYHTSSFDEAIAKSVNLLGDADSHGSITGQLAGALYGWKSINPQFRNWVAKWDEHEFAARGLLLQYIGAQAKDTL